MCVCCSRAENLDGRGSDSGRMIGAEFLGQQRGGIPVPTKKSSFQGVEFLGTSGIG